MTMQDTEYVSADWGDAVVMDGHSIDEWSDLVTADEVRDPNDLGIRCILNDETVQDSNTAQLIFKIPELIAYLSHVFTLNPGDLIFTGTPPGVGMARDPQLWLKAGDKVVCEVDGIGRLENPVG